MSRQSTYESSHIPERWLDLLTGYVEIVVFVGACFLVAAVILAG